MHQKSFEVVSWGTIKQSIEDLPRPKNWHNVSSVQKLHSQHLKKLDVLNQLIRKISGTNDIEDHIEVICESLEGIHKDKPKHQQFLSGAHLHFFFEHLIQLPKFKKPLLKFKTHYEAVNELVKKIAGTNELETITYFLKTQFPSLRAKDISWSSIFVQVEHLASNISSRSYSYEMKKLLDKFTNDKALDFFQKMYPEVADEEIFKPPVLLDLKTLCNHVADLRRHKKSTEHL